EKGMPALHPARAVGRLNRFHLEPRLVRVVLDVPRVVPGTEKTRVLPGPDERAFHQESRKRDPSRDAVRSRTKVVQAGRVTWPVVSRGDLVEDPPGDRHAGQYLVGGEQVVVLAMRQRTDEGAAIHPGRELRQVLTNLDARDRRRDRLELPANLGRC